MFFMQAIDTPRPAVDTAAMRVAADQAGALLRMLGNPDRLMLLCQLLHGECCVSQLEARSGISQPTLSQQLAVLRGADLVSTRRQGKQVFYRIASAHAVALIELLYQRFCAAPKEKA